MSHWTQKTQPEWTSRKTQWCGCAERCCARWPSGVESQQKMELQPWLRHMYSGSSLRSSWWLESGAAKLPEQVLEKVFGEHALAHLAFAQRLENVFFGAAPRVGPQLLDAREPRARGFAVEALEGEAELVFEGGLPSAERLR